MVSTLFSFINKFCIVSLWIRIISRLVEYYSTGLPDCPILIIFTPVLALFMAVVAMLDHSKTWWVPGLAYFTNTFCIVCPWISIISTYVEFYSTGLPRLCHFINSHPCISKVYECCRDVITFKKVVSTLFSFINKFCIVSLWIRIISRLVEYYSTGLPDCPILIIFTPVLTLFMSVVAL